MAEPRPPADPVTIVGGGPAGALAALMLSRRGYRVRLFESRDDPRVASGASAAAAGGARGDEAALAKTASAVRRSINLALSHRGLCAMRRVAPGLATAVLADAVPMKGRMIHGRDGEMALQPYGSEPDEVLYSIGRQTINVFLLEQLRPLEARAEDAAGSVRANYLL